MDVRVPDSYKMDTLVNQNQNNHVDEDLDRVLQASLEENWLHEKKKKDSWDSFQGLLQTLKRIGSYDKNIQELYVLLSMVLYSYAYEIDQTFTEKQNDYILEHIKTVRIRAEDRERLTRTLTHLRFSP